MEPLVIPWADLLSPLIGFMGMLAGFEFVVTWFIAAGSDEGVGSDD